jgi:hypothetical protein
MTDVTPSTPSTPAQPSGPPAGWYDDTTTPGRQRWYDGTMWTDHYQTPAAAPQQPVPVTVAAPVQTNVRQAADKAQYVRQQKGHSLVKHLLLGWLLLYIPTIYYAASPNHYFHA